MYQRKTVFIIGAGCSAEFGLPVGTGLRNMISGNLKGNTESLFRALANSPVGPMVTNLQDMVPNFVGGLHTKPSIDQYLHFHRDDPVFVMLGKLAIAWAILESERNSALRRAAIDLGMTSIGESWFMKLFQGMNDDIDIGTVEHLFNNVSFICFNYDRCIEVAFFNAIRILTRAPIERVANVMKGLRIWHPYGTVGRLDYMDASGNSPLLGFSESVPDWIDISKGAGQLRTFTEGMNNKAMLGEIRQALHDAQQIVYLGFGFLDQNMDILESGTADPASKIYATCLGLSGADAELAKYAIASASCPQGGSLGERFGKVILHEDTAVGFFNHWGNTLRR